MFNGGNDGETQKLEMRREKKTLTPWKAVGKEGQRIFPLHLGQDPMFGLMVPLPKKGLQIMLILKMFLLAIKWLQLLISIDPMSLICIIY